MKFIGKFTRMFPLSILLQENVSAPIYYYMHIDTYFDKAENYKQTSKKKKNIFWLICMYVMTDTL